MVSVACSCIRMEELTDACALPPVLVSLVAGQSLVCISGNQKKNLTIDIPAAGFNLPYARDTIATRQSSTQFLT